MFICSSVCLTCLHTIFNVRIDRKNKNDKTCHRSLLTGSVNKKGKFKERVNLFISSATSTQRRRVFSWLTRLKWFIQALSTTQSQREDLRVKDGKIKVLDIWRSFLHPTAVELFFSCLNIGSYNSLVHSCCQFDHQQFYKAYEDEPCGKEQKSLYTACSGQV